MAAICNINTMDLSNVQILDAQNSSNSGPRIAKIVETTPGQAPAPATFRITNDTMRAPFGPSSFDKDPAATKKTIDIQGDTIVDIVSSIEKWALEQVTSAPHRFFPGTPITSDEIRFTFCSAVKRSDRYATTVRTKCITSSDMTSLTVWDGDRKRIPIPESWMRIDIKSGSFRLSHLWFMNKRWGVVINTTDLLIYQMAVVEAVCPF